MFLFYTFRLVFNPLQQILFTAQSVLMTEKHSIGLALLQCIASYLSYHMYIILDVHTESTIAAGKRELLTFQCHLEVS